MSTFLVVAAAGAVSYLCRISMLVLAARGGVPAAVERSALFAVPVAFAALAATSLGTAVIETGAGSLPALGAVAVGAAAVRRTGSSQAALLAGMPTLWVLSWVAAVS